MNIQTKSGKKTALRDDTEDWEIVVVDTGMHSQTGGRLKHVRDYVEGRFCFTYGDGLADINIEHLINSHLQSGKLATVTAVRPPGRFGALKIDNNNVEEFTEKPSGDGGWINGGFFVCEKEVIDRISSYETIWEAEPLTSLCHDRQLNAYMHDGFWASMDTLRDRNKLEELWNSGEAPWKIW